MNKISQKPELPIEYISLNKAQTDCFRHRMIMKTSQLINKQISTSGVYTDPVAESDSERKSIFIKKQALERTLSVYQWRHRTCYPVVKPVKLVVKSFTGNGKEKRTLCRKDAQGPFQIWNLDQNLYQLIVATEKVPQRLSEIISLPLPQVFYLLKQTLVGFECLIDIFGIFEPSEEMIAVNDQKEWRFWISEDFASNSKKEASITEAEFILRIIKMVELRLTNSKAGAKFFQELKNLPAKSFTFLNVLDMTNIFISFNKIIVAKKFVPATNHNNKSLHGSKNQSYFRLNRTYNQLKESTKNANDKTFVKNNHGINNLQQHSPKHLSSGIHKINTLKYLADKTAPPVRKESFALNSSGRQNELKKDNNKQMHSQLKISEFYYPQTLTKNNIEKRGSFLFSSGQLAKQKSKQDIHKGKVSIGCIPETAQSPAPVKQGSKNHVRTDTCIQGGFKFRPISPRERKFSFENMIKTEPNLAKLQSHVQDNIPAVGSVSPPKQRKNSFYNLEKPANKEAFSESPNKSSAKHNIFAEERKMNKQLQKPQLKVHTKRQNILMQEESTTRPRKYSQSVPKIRSLDEFARKQKKMFQSSTMQVVQNNNIKYGNLKSKDMACHVRHATISGMAFGQSPKKKQNDGFNNIDNDLYNGKFEEIMRSIKSRSNGDKNEEREEVNEGVMSSRKRRVTLFEKVREVSERKVSEEFELEIRRKHEHSPLSGNELSPKPIIRVSNANNKTAESLNKSEMNIAKGSQQSNSLSNNNNSNIKQSDTHSNQQSQQRGQDRRGLIGQSNLSVFSCRTYQPGGKQIDRRFGALQRSKGMTSSQDCFDKRNESESSQEFMKSNNWNKKISGLFSEVASIKMLKESSHFGDEFEMFEKDHLREVRLERLDKFGKELKGSIIEMEDGRQLLNVPTRGLHNKSFSLIQQVKEEPYENDPSYLEYSTSMICQSRNVECIGSRAESPQVEKSVKHCESFEQEQGQLEPIANGGFSFATELYKLGSHHQ